MIILNEKKTAQNSGKKSIIKVLAMSLLLLLLIAAAAAAVANFSGVSLFGAVEPKSTGQYYSVEPDNINDFEAFDSGLVLLSDSAIQYIDASGREISSSAHSFSKPVMEVNSKTVLLYDKGGRQFRIEKNAAVYNSYTVNGAITCAALGKRNNYAYVLNEDGGYQSHLYIYSFRGTKQFEWGSASDYCLDIALSDNGRRAAVCASGVNNAEFYSRVILFDFNSSEQLYSAEFSDCTVFSIEFIDSKRVAAYTDKGIYILDETGNRTAVQEYSSNELKHIAAAHGGLKCSVISKYGNEQAPVINVFNKKAKLLFTREYNEKLTGADTSSRFTALMFEDSIEVLNRENAVVGTVTLSDGGIKCVINGSKLFVHTASGLYCVAAAGESSLAESVSVQNIATTVQETITAAQNTNVVG